MEDAMQDNTMRKSVQKHRRKMKRKTVLEYAIAFSAIAVGLPVLLWYLYRQFLLFRQMPEVVQFYFSVKWLAVLVLCILSVFGDWAMFDVLYALTFFRYRENPREKWLTFSGITLVCCVSMLGNEPIWSGLFQLGIFLVIPLIQYCYNGESGSKKPFHKWFFYVFYPLHLLVLGILRWVVFA